MSELLMPEIKDQHRWNPEFEDRSNVWLFSIRWLDEARFQAWTEQDFSGKELTILGPPQAGPLGIRFLVPIVEMAQTMETMKAHGLGIPEPIIFCPIHINAWANSVDIELNQKMADFYHNLAQRYFEVFHPHLPLPSLKIDKKAGVENIAQLAPLVKNSLSPDTLAELLNMANNHTGEMDIETLMEKTAGYLIAHYIAYGYLPAPEYCEISKPTMFLVPPSEEKFHHLIEAEANTIAIDKIIEPDAGPGGLIIVAYSNTLKNAHYYPHKGEPDLTGCISRFPTIKQLSRTRGLNGRARDEIWAGVKLIQADIGGRQNAPQLQQQVLSPLTDQMYDLTYLS